jgi:hypothetical protein
MDRLDFTLLTDGSSDAILIHPLTWLLQQHCSFGVNGTWADLRRLPNPPKILCDRIAAALDLYPCHLLFVHRDAEGETLDRRLTEIKDAVADLPDPLVPVVPVRMQEAWLLIEEPALRCAAGNPNGGVGLVMPAIDRLEEIPNPKQVLYELLIGASELTGRRRKKLNPGRLAMRLGELIEDFSPLRRLAAFQHTEAETLAVLRRPEKPGSVSILGERRFGKSSFINQIYGALAAEPGLVSIHATTQDWSDAHPERFFGGLRAAIRRALDRADHTFAESEPKPATKGKAKGEVGDYSSLRGFIKPLARDGLRLVLLLDELERITGSEKFDAEFFSNLRALGERPEHRFGYLISSRRPLKELCRDNRIEESSFWNIAGPAKKGVYAAYTPPRQAAQRDLIEAGDAARAFLQQWELMGAGLAGGLVH